MLILALIVCLHNQSNVTNWFVYSVVYVKKEKFCHIDHFCLHCSSNMGLTNYITNSCLVKFWLSIHYVKYKILLLLLGIFLKLCQSHLHSLFKFLCPVFSKNLAMSIL